MKSSIGSGSSQPSRETAVELFNAISKRYDVMNRIMTLWQDQRWRKVLAKHIPKRAARILDCATGTGDQLLAILKIHPKCEEIWGIDPALAMLDLAGKKILKTSHYSKVHFLQTKAHELPFNESYFDAISISFGIRNVEDVILTLKEMRRVLTPNGQLLILECSKPNTIVFKSVHKFFLQHVIPIIGYFISGSKCAYRYLADTVDTFPYGSAFCDLVKEAGFSTCMAYPLSLGITTLYVAKSS